MEININDTNSLQGEAFKLAMSKLERIEQFITGLSPVLEECKRIKAETAGYDKPINTKEVAEMLDVSSRTLQRYRDNKMIKFHTQGGRIKYHREDVEKFMDEQRAHKNKFRDFISPLVSTFTEK